MPSNPFGALTRPSSLGKALREHFQGMDLGDIVTAARTFPIISRVDIQAALDEIFDKSAGRKLLGILSPMMARQPLSLGLLFSVGPFPIDIGPLQYEEIDIGDPTPVRCLQNGLWLSQHDSLPFALLLALNHTGVHVEIGIPKGNSGQDSRRSFFGIWSFAWAPVAPIAGE